MRMHFENGHHYSDTIAIEFFFYTGGIAIYWPEFYNFCL